VLMHDTYKDHGNDRLLVVRLPKLLHVVRAEALHKLYELPRFQVQAVVVCLLWGGRGRGAAHCSGRRKGAR
jgi:hypothetical protein